MKKSKKNLVSSAVLFLIGTPDDWVSTKVSRVPIKSEHPMRLYVIYIHLQCIDLTEYTIGLKQSNLSLCIHRISI